MTPNHRYIEESVAEEVELGRLRDRSVPGRKPGHFDAYRARAAAWWATTYVLSQYWGTFPSEDHF